MKLLRIVLAVSLILKKVFKKQITLKNDTNIE
ncbi:hypothetical protein EDC24_2113 [Aquisalibacillus elongatus]|uniref:Uncharacterized protein n=1 Tax=Aquisalibacillus elongatus TaxID=485577 RepID=A0A3N5B476_9BACI|nr:hypothetical protein EDC24_2113 [Aquisalibacillus elongatus]